MKIFRNLNRDGGRQRCECIKCYLEWLFLCHFHLSFQKQTEDMRNFLRGLLHRAWGVQKCWQGQQPWIIIPISTAHPVIPVFKTKPNPSLVLWSLAAGIPFCWYPLQETFSQRALTCCHHLICPLSSAEHCSTGSSSSSLSAALGSGSLPCPHSSTTHCPVFLLPASHSFSAFHTASSSFSKSRSVPGPSPCCLHALSWWAHHISWPLQQRLADNLSIYASLALWRILLGPGM